MGIHKRKCHNGRSPQICEEHKGKAPNSKLSIFRAITPCVEPAPHLLILVMLVFLLLGLTCCLDLLLGSVCCHHDSFTLLIDCVVHVKVRALVEHPQLHKTRTGHVVKRMLFVWQHCVVCLATLCCMTCVCCIAMCTVCLICLIMVKCFSMPVFTRGLGVLNSLL